MVCGTYAKLTLVSLFTKLAENLGTKTPQATARHFLVSPSVRTTSSGRRLTAPRIESSVASLRFFGPRLPAPPSGHAFRPRLPTCQPNRGTSLSDILGDDCAHGLLLGQLHQSVCHQLDLSRLHSQLTQNTSVFHLWTLRILHSAH